MTYAYFPGCTLKTRGAALDKWGRLCAEALGFTLEELPQWQCCGAVYPIAKNEVATRLSSVRALIAARDQGRPLVTLCSACHHVLKRVNRDVQTNETIRDKANRSIAPAVPYTGETQVLHYLEVLRDHVGFEELAKKVVKPLTGQKIGAYYGCMLLRPGKEMGFDDPENPQVLENFIRAIGAEPVYYAQRNECCGGYCTINNKEFADSRAKIILSSAEKAGAQTLITACPLCLYNLQQPESNIQVRYFTELLAEALGIKEDTQ